MSKNISRKAYLLTTDFESERTIFSSVILSNIGFRKMYSGSFIQLVGIGPEKAVKLYANDIA
jgi:hypothetical protein